MVNTETDSATSVTLANVAPGVQSLTPNSVSPVLKQDLTIEMMSSFPDIDISQYTVEIRGSSDYQRQLNIVSWNNITKQMKVKFNGAPSDDYVIVVKGPDGFLAGPRLTLTTIIAVDSITPMKGSVLGGTLVTITGNHYGTQASDNPVKIGENYCLVEQTSEFEIKCRVQIRKPTVVSEAEVIVFAKTYEEMTCNLMGGNGCLFDYEDSTSTVSSISSSFDSASNSIELTV